MWEFASPVVLSTIETHVECSRLVPYVVLGESDTFLARLEHNEFLRRGFVGMRRSMAVCLPLCVKLEPLPPLITLNSLGDRWWLNTSERDGHGIRRARYEKKIAFKKNLNKK